MTEAEVVHAMRQHLEGLFPKDCPHCQRRFATLREYVQTTERVGPATSYDAEVGRWRPLRPLGTMSSVNCPCGTTLTVSSHGMPLVELWALLAWARSETQARGITMSELLEYLRDEICRQVLAAPE